MPATACCLRFFRLSERGVRYDQLDASLGRILQRLCNQRRLRISGPMPISRPSLQLRLQYR